jgi:chaperone BCS1
MVYVLEIYMFFLADFFAKAVAGEERLVFMTTNHLEALDPALIRPGRVDTMCHVGPATNHQIARLFARFYAGHEHRAVAFAKAAADHGLSMAAMQGYFMLNRESVDNAFKHLPEFLTASAALKKQQQTQQQ